MGDELLGPPIEVIDYDSPEIADLDLAAYREVVRHLLQEDYAAMHMVRPEFADTATRHLAANQSPSWRQGGA